MKLRKRGLFLCSKRVSLEHPFYNTDQGKEAFRLLEASGESLPNGMWVSPDGKVMVTVSIDLPDKFKSIMERESERYEQLSDEEPVEEE